MTQTRPALQTRKRKLVSLTNEKAANSKRRKLVLPLQTRNGKRDSVHACTQEHRLLSNASIRRRQRPMPCTRTVQLPTCRPRAVHGQPNRCARIHAFCSCSQRAVRRPSTRPQRHTGPLPGTSGSEAAESHHLTASAGLCLPNPASKEPKCACAQSGCVRNTTCMRTQPACPRAQPRPESATETGQKQRSGNTSIRPAARPYSGIPRRTAAESGPGAATG